MARKVSNLNTLLSGATAEEAFDIYDDEAYHLGDTANPSEDGVMSASDKEQLLYCVSKIQELTSLIGSGVLDTTSQTVIPAINEVASASGLTLAEHSVSKNTSVVSEGAAWAYALGNLMIVSGWFLAPEAGTGRVHYTVDKGYATRDSWFPSSGAGVGNGQIAYDSNELTFYVNTANVYTHFLAIYPFKETPDHVDPPTPVYPDTITPALNSSSVVALWGDNVAASFSSSGIACSGAAYEGSDGDTYYYSSGQLSMVFGQKFNFDQYKKITITADKNTFRSQSPTDTVNAYVNPTYASGSISDCTKIATAMTASSDGKTLTINLNGSGEQYLYLRVALFNLSTPSYPITVTSVVLSKT